MVSDSSRRTHSFLEDRRERTPNSPSMGSFDSPHVSSGAGERVEFFGHGFTFLHASDRRTVLLDRLEPGGGVPLHSHAAMDEVFYVLEGEFRFGVGEKSFTAGVGDAIVVEPGVPHGFRCVGPDSGLLLNVCSPGGFREFVDAVLELDRAGAGSPDRFAELGRKHGTEMVGGMPE